MEILDQQPFLALFLVIAIGYSLGAVNIKGFSLGVGAVLFSGLFVGALAPKSPPPAMVGSLGLVMFLYGLGVQFGRQFFTGLMCRHGRRYNGLAALALLAASVVTVAELAVLHVSPPLMAGLFAGSGTSASAMQAAMEAAGSSDPAVGYSVAFPFGLAGAILCMYLMQRVVRPSTEAIARSGLLGTEVAIRSAEVVGRTLGEVTSLLPETVRVLAVRVGEVNRHPDPWLVLGADDVLLIGSDEVAALETARQLLGERVFGRMVGDRTRIDYLHVFVSRPELVGTTLSDLKLPEGVEATVTHVERGDTEMLVTPRLTLEFGDRVGLLTGRESFQSLREFFGNSIRGTAEFSYVSLGIGMALGVLLGIVAIPVPLLGSLKLGLAGGSLVVALILGRLGRTWRFTWTMPLSANLTLRNFGLSVFLAQAGMSSGAPFVRVVQESGLSFLAAGACILFALALTPLLIGHYLMRIPFDDLLGVTAGVTGSPAILAYAFRSYPSDRVELCYAMIYPTATVLKIVIAQSLVGLGTGG